MIWYTNTKPTKYYYRLLKKLYLRSKVDGRNLEVNEPLTDGGLVAVVGGSAEKDLDQGRTGPAGH